MVLIKLNILEKGKKRKRDSQENKSNNTYSEQNKFSSLEYVEKREKGYDIEVKLICDLPNEDLKKSFIKSVKLNLFYYQLLFNNHLLFEIIFKKIFTHKNNTLEYFSKYICFKLDLKYDIKDKIVFYTFDENEVIKSF